MFSLFLMAFWAVENVDGALEKSFVLYLECRHFSCRFYVDCVKYLPYLVKLSEEQG